jgi:hypothetical protein
MADLTLKLDGEALQQATLQALVGQLTPEVREQLIASAVSKFIATPTDTRYGAKAPMVEAMERAMYEAMHQAARDLVAQDETIKPRLKKLLADTFERLVVSHPEQLTDVMASAFVRAFSPRS